MEPSVHTDRVAAYLAELRPHLDDLDPSERAEVLDELTDALREVAAEDHRPLREVLGPPADYVAAYRASAGLESGSSRSRPGLRARAASLDATVRAQPWWPHASALLRLLRPSWWTVRGGVLAALPVWLLFGSVSSLATLPGLLYVIAVVAVSMAAGDGRRWDWGRILHTAANVIAILAVVPIANMPHADGWNSGFDAGLQEARWESEAGGQLAKPSGAPVTNIYPYLRDGEPLEDVLLFDGEGQPLRLVPEGESVVLSGSREFEILYERDAGGQPITNLYPLEQNIIEYDDSTGEANRRPRTAPAIVLPPAMRADASEAPASDTTVDTTAPATAPSEG